MRILAGVTDEHLSRGGSSPLPPYLRATRTELSSAPLLMASPKQSALKIALFPFSSFLYPLTIRPSVPSPSSPPFSEARRSAASTAAALIQPAIRLLSMQLRSEVSARNTRRHRAEREPAVVSPPAASSLSLSPLQPRVVKSVEARGAALACD